MRLSRRAEIMLRAGVGVTLAFVYIPLAVIAIYAFNGATGTSWPPSDLTTKWFGEAIGDHDVQQALLTSLKVGALATLQGAFTVLGEDGMRGVKLALQQHNNMAGGKKIELVTGSSDASPDSAVNAARKLVEQDGVQVLACHVDRAVNDETGNVDVIVRLIEQRVAVDIDFDQAGSVDFLVEHAVRIDQELVGCARHAAGDVVGHHLGHPVHRGEPVAGREIDPGLPLLRAYLLAD